MKTKKTKLMNFIQTAPEDAQDDNATLPAIPPDDYKGTQADWMVGLQAKGLWDGQNPEWHGDLQIPAKDWWELLEQCEAE